MMHQTNDSKNNKPNTSRTESALSTKDNYKHTKKIKKYKILTYVFSIILFLCVCLLLYSGYHILIWHKDNKAIEQIKDDINEITDVQEVEDDEKVEVVKPQETTEQEETVHKDNPYWDYIKMNLIDVDLSELKKINSDTVGWIQVRGTNINYPFVQTKDNEFYLDHAFNKKKNNAGWVFLDYRNNIKELDKNTILYAHARLDKSMFGSLKNILKSNWYEDKNNHIIRLSTANQNTLWQVFSVYHIPTTNDYIQVDFKDNIEFKQFVDMLQKRSVYKFDTTVNPDDKIITLSTCYGEDEKMVMHAKLIKYSNK